VNVAKLFLIGHQECQQGYFNTVKGCAKWFDDGGHEVNGDLFGSHGQACLPFTRSTINH
jgi:hypothetical protein